jgi:predicted CXXCH cytochrome family protein
MRKAILMVMVVAFVLLLGMVANAYAATPPHGGYSASTEFCLQCHSVHESQGDYVLSREATITELCGTCHGLFGQAADGLWTDPPIDMTDGSSPPATMNATVSQYTAYEVDMSSMSGAEMDAVPGHSLGVMYDGTPVRNSDAIPGGSGLLRVITSGEPGEPHAWNAAYSPRYQGEVATTFNATAGLNCASCHTPHGSPNATDTDGDGNPDDSWGVQFTAGGRHAAPASKLLSSRPNHVADGVVTQGDYNSWCIACHDLRDDWAGPSGDINGGDTTGIHNHPPVCTSCHGNPGNDPSSVDFPHTSSNPDLIEEDNDSMCTGCHPKGTLP